MQATTPTHEGMHSYNAEYLCAALGSYYSDRLRKNVIVGKI